MVVRGVVNRMIKTNEQIEEVLCGDKGIVGDGMCRPRWKGGW